MNSSNQMASRRKLLDLSARGVLATAVAGGLTGKAQAADTPRISYASWVHGHGLEVQSPEMISSLVRMGWGTVLECLPGTTNWLHMAIPTPVIINDVRLRLDTVMLSFTTGSTDAYIREVHVWDGPVRIAVFDGLNLSGDNPFVRLEVADRPWIWFGIGLSIGISVGVEQLSHHIEVWSAGCDFVV